MTGGGDGEGGPGRGDRYNRASSDARYQSAVPQYTVLYCPEEILISIVDRSNQTLEIKIYPGIVMTTVDYPMKWHKSLLKVYECGKARP